MPAVVNQPKLREKSRVKVLPLPSLRRRKPSASLADRPASSRIWLALAGSYSVCGTRSQSPG